MVKSKTIYSKDKKYHVTAHYNEAGNPAICANIYRAGQNVGFADDRCGHTTWQDFYECMLNKHNIDLDLPNVQSKQLNSWVSIPCQ